MSNREMNLEHGEPADEPWDMDNDELFADPDDLEEMADFFDDTAQDDNFGDWWNPVEQGMYDDDPSPYSGDYSEM